MSVNEKIVNIFGNEQLEERFLRDINPKGQVPALTSPSIEKPLVDSLDITYFLMKRHPQLQPEAFATTIVSLLADLHAINYFSLTFQGKPSIAQDLLRAITAKLEGDISTEYRKLLEYKLTITGSEKVQGVEENTTISNEEKAIKLMDVLKGHLSEEGPWLFGLGTPCALDAHVLPFIARMRDIGRYSLVPPALRSYAEKGWESPKYKATMEGFSAAN